MTKKVFIVNSSRPYARLFERLGFDVTQHHSKASLLCFTGGADVTPALYGAFTHKLTSCSPLRDRDEGTVFNLASTAGVPMVGICRGAQFLNVMSGGSMYQHVTGHTRYHQMVDVGSGEKILVSSTHHQMMKPSERGEILAYAAEGGTREWYEGEEFKSDVSDRDIEVVYYRHTNCLCFQPHPEFFDKHEELPRMSTYFGELINKRLLKGQP